MLQQKKKKEEQEKLKFVFTGKETATMKCHLKFSHARVSPAELTVSATQSRARAASTCTWKSGNEGLPMKSLVHCFGPLEEEFQT